MDRRKGFIEGRRPCDAFRLCVVAQKGQMSLAAKIACASAIALRAACPSPSSPSSPIPITVSQQPMRNAPFPCSYGGAVASASAKAYKTPMLNQQTIQNQSDRRSACPGLSRMVMAKDGAIARIKLRLGRLPRNRRFALADIAEHSGARAIELSIRSNVQLRGIAPARWDEVVTALYEAGLGADNPAADDIRNVMVSPTAGIDPGQICDVTGLASDLLAMLQAEKAFHALSPKFSLQVDGGKIVP